MRFVNLAILPCERQEAKIYPAPLSFWIWGAFFILCLVILIQEIDLANLFSDHNYLILDRRDDGYIGG